jgi:alpha-tubulin suppressor-like RCC1 family protein
MANLPYVDLGTGRTAKAIAAQASSSCALLDNGQLKCWGYNDDGQLGIGSVESKGDNANEMGDNLPAVDIGP